MSDDKLNKHTTRLNKLLKQKQEKDDAPKKEKALQLAAQPVDISRYRNERNLMLYPFCSTSKRKRLKSIEYKSTDGRRWLEVTANHKYGMAKIWDFDILRYALSKAGEIARLVGYFPDAVEFSAYECLKALGRNPESGKNVQWMAEALARLTSTTYKSNIFRDEENITTIFTLINSEYVRTSKGIDKIRVTFNERLRDSARYFKGLLAIDFVVIHEQAGIKKRLLELVNVSKGDQISWTVSIVRLQQMCAHEGALKRFKYELSNYILPWKVSFSKAVEGGENVTFTDPGN